MTGLCACGCGEATRVATHTDRSKGWIKGEPLKFVRYHRVKPHINPGLRSSGRNHPSWRGGRSLTARGYVVVGGAYEHRLVMEEALGRPLLDSEVVHHINRVPDDNRLDNLMLFSSNTKHLEHHSAIQGEIPAPDEKRCPRCGDEKLRAAFYRTSSYCRGCMADYSKARNALATA